MNLDQLPPLGSIEAIRPVFWIVMGLFLMVIAWRLSRFTSAWTARFLLAGALLLGFGYSVMLPLYEAGYIERFSSGAHYHGSETTAMFWQAARILVMNGGWLMLGIGLALHAKVFSSPTPRIAVPLRSSTPALPPAAPHECTR